MSKNKEWITPAIRPFYYGFLDDRLDSEYPLDPPVKMELFEHMWNGKPYICNFEEAVPGLYVLSGDRTFDFDVKYYPNFESPRLNWKWPTSWPSVKVSRRIQRQKKALALKLLEKTNYSAFVRLAIVITRNDLGLRHNENPEETFAINHLRTLIDDWKK